jgi:hypothetical protein
MQCRNPDHRFVRGIARFGTEYAPDPITVEITPRSQRLERFGTRALEP